MLLAVASGSPCPLHALHPVSQKCQNVWVYDLELLWCNRKLVWKVEVGDGFPVQRCSRECTRILDTYGS